MLGFFWPNNFNVSGQPLKSKRSNLWGEAYDGGYTFLKGTGEKGVVIDVAHLFASGDENPPVWKDPRLPPTHTNCWRKMASMREDSSHDGDGGGDDAEGPAREKRKLTFDPDASITHLIDDATKKTGGKAAQGVLLAKIEDLECQLADEKSRTSKAQTKLASAQVTINALEKKVEDLFNQINGASAYLQASKTIWEDTVGVVDDWVDKDEEKYEYDEKTLTGPHPACHTAKNRFKEFLTQNFLFAELEEEFLPKSARRPRVDEDNDPTWDNLPKLKKDVDEEESDSDDENVVARKT